MDLLSVIRRWRFRQGMPIREIERRTGLSRNTIRKYLRADTLEPVFIPNCTKTDSDLGFPNGKKSDSMASLAWRARYGSID